MAYFHKDLKLTDEQFGKILQSIDDLCDLREVRQKLVAAESVFTKIDLILQHYDIVKPEQGWDLMIVIEAVEDWAQKKYLERANTDEQSSTGR